MLAPVPVTKDDRLRERVASLCGAEMFTDVERALADADVLFLSRVNGEELVLMPIRFWNRLVANVAASWGALPDFSDLSKGTR